MSSEMKKLFKNIHRWIGLLLVGFVVFYCFTGILLNHRKGFNYFIYVLIATGCMIFILAIVVA